MRKQLFLTNIILVVFLFKVSAGNDTVPKKNTLKYNITAPLLWGSRNYIFEYERVVKDYQSFNVSVGYRSFPKLIGVGKSDSAFIVRNHKNKGGLSVNLDYRFYFKNENCHYAPRGIYMGPYVNYLTNNVENTISTFYSDIASLTLHTKFEVLSIGAQLGYQFVYKNRLTFDVCMIGPSLSWYNVHMKLSGEADVKNKELFNKMSELVVETYPVVKMLFDEYEISSSGRTSKLFYGYRYCMKVGYRF